MKKLRGDNQITAIIPTASMADIAFLLVVFFMVTTVFQVDKTTVDLPLSGVREEVPRGSAFVVVHDDGAGGVIYKFSSGEENSRDIEDLAGVYTEVSMMTAISQYYRFVLKADATLPYERIDEVIQVLRKAKAVHVILLTQEE